MARPALVNEEQPGQIGPYEVTEQLGQGGMATVYRARLRGAADFQRDVVLKAMLPALAQNPALVAMFEDEARLTAQLRHPNIVQVEDYGVAGAIPYLIMEYLDGKNLSQLRNALNKAKRRVPVGVAVSIVRDLCLALGYAHTFIDASGQRMQIIHRDVSPSNVMVQRDGSVKLLDFGVAKLSSAAGQAVTTSLKGKFAYMAPEQVNQEPIDRRCDVFAAGIVFHELLTGKRLFGTKSELDTLRRVSLAEAAPPSLLNPDVPPAVDALVMRALSRRPDDRFDSGKKMAEALEGLGIAAGRRALAQLIEESFPLSPQRPSASPSKLISIGESLAPDIEREGDTDAGNEDEVALDETDPHRSARSPRGDQRAGASLGISGPIEVSTSSSGTIELGTNPSGAIELGTNPSGAIELGTNPAGVMWSAGFDALRSGADYATGEEVRPTRIYDAAASEDAAVTRMRSSEQLLEGVATRVHQPIEPQEGVATRVHQPLEPLEGVATRVHQQIEPIARSASGVEAPALGVDRLFEEPQRTMIRAGGLPLDEPEANAFLLPPPETSAPHQAAAAPRAGRRVLVVAVALVLVIGAALVVRQQRARQAPRPWAVGAVLVEEPSRASPPTKNELVVPTSPVPRLPPPAIGVPADREEATSLVGLGERPSRRAAAGSTTPETKAPASRPHASPSSGSSSKRPTRSINEGRIVDPFEGGE